MKNNELQRVLQEVQQQMQYTVLSYPERDPHGFKWGNPGYNGNCTGKIPLGFIDKLGAKSVFEMYAGSGTLSDVCRDYGIKYCGVDLNPNPVRDDIFFMDVCDLDQEFPLAIHDADFVFQHPVYPGIKRIKYANNAWKDTTGGLESKDIQNLPFYEGMKKINQATLRAYAAMQPGAYMAILVGEIRADGRYYSMYQNLALPGEIFQTYVKLQHNTWSDRQSYSGKQNPRALTGHEMIALIKKPSGYEIAYVIPKEYRSDIRDCKMATWTDLLLAVIRPKEHEFSNQEIYDELKGCKKAENNHHVEAKLRQTLQVLVAAGFILRTSPGWYKKVA